MGTNKHQVMRALITDALIELCRKEAFYVEELRIEGTVCLVSDRSSVLIAQITEQIGEKSPPRLQTPQGLPYLECEQELLPDQVIKQEDPGDGDLESGGRARETREEAVCGHGRGLADGRERARDVGKQTTPRAPGTQQGRKRSQPPPAPPPQPPQPQSELQPMMTLSRKDGKYRCPFCPKNYSFKHNLKDHINKHTGRRPHVCKYCALTFSHLASMCAHIKRRHFNFMPREFQCDLCGNRFPNEQSLKQHVTWRHNPGHKAARGRKKAAGSAAASAARNQMDPLAAWDSGNGEEAARNPDQRPSDAVHNMNAGSWMEEENGGGGGVAAESNSRRKYGGATTEEATLYRDHHTGQTTVDGSVHGGSGQLSLLDRIKTENAACLPPEQQLPSPLPRGGEGTPHSRAQDALLSMCTQFSPMGAFPMLPPMPMFPLPPPPSPGGGPVPPMAFGFPLQEPKDPAADIQRSPDGKFNCPYCAKAYNFKHTLKDHINTHFGKKPHVCKHCGDSFTHFASLCAHIKRRHKDKIPKDFQCEICAQDFMNLQSLKQHYTWRHKDTKFPLMKSLTGGGAATSGSGGSPRRSPSASLTGGDAAAHHHHQRPQLSSPTGAAGVATTATGTVGVGGGGVSQPLPSPVSPTLPSVEAFMKGGVMSLPAISLQHVFPEQLLEEIPGASTSPSTQSPVKEEEQYVLEESQGQGFESSEGEGRRSVSPLPASPNFTVTEFFDQVSVKTEHGVYRYRCKTCGNMFKVRNSLYEHMNSHLGKKPNVCNHCGDSFTHHSSLHNHVRNKHTYQSPAQKEAALKHPCPGCDRRFRFPSELERHLKTNPDHDVDAS